MNRFKTSLLFLALACSVHAQPKAVTKEMSDNTLNENLATGARSFTISPTGTLVFTSGAGITGASYFRTALGLAIGSDVQAYDADLTTYAGITPSANVQSLLAAADYSAMRTALGLAIGSDVQAYDADLTTYAGITPSANVQSLLAAANYSAMRTALGLAIGTNVQAYDADLTTYAGITPSANVQSLLGAASYATVRALLSLGPVAIMAQNNVLFTGGNINNLSTLSLLNSGTGAYIMSLAHNGTLTADRALTFNVNDAARTISLSGNLTVSSAATISGTNTGDQTIDGILPSQTGNSGKYLTTNGTTASWGSITGFARLSADNTYTGAQTITNGIITTSKPLSISQEWNGSGVTFQGILVDVTLTAFANGPSSLLELKSNGSTRLFVDHGGTTYFGGNSGATSTLIVDTNGLIVSMRSNAGLDAMGDTRMYRDAAGVWAMRNGGTAHTLRIYGTTTGSKYLSLQHDGTDAVISSSSGGVAIGSGGTPHSKIKSGVATLVAGTVTVSDTDVLETGTAATSSRIFVQRMNDGGTVGDSFTITRVNGTSFTITSKSGGSTASGDTSDVCWSLFNP